MLKKSCKEMFRLIFVLLLVGSFGFSNLWAYDDDDDDDDDDDQMIEEEAQDSRSNEERCSDIIHDTLDYINSVWTDGETLRILHVYAFSQKNFARRPFPDYRILRDIQWNRLTIRNADGSQSLTNNPADGDPRPEDTLENIQKRTVEACTRRIRAEFNMEEQMNTLLREADEKFKMYKEGENIPVLQERRNGGPVTTHENVVFMKLGADRIQLSNRVINRDDLDEETEAKFDPILNEKIKSKFIENGLARLNRDLNVQIEREIRRQLPIAFKEAGWIPNILDKAEDAGWTNIHPEKWTTISRLVAKFKKLKIDRDIETKLFGTVKARMLQEANVIPDDRKFNNDYEPILEEAPHNQRSIKYNDKRYYLCNTENRAEVQAFLAVGDNSVPYKRRKVLWVTKEEYAERK